MYVINKTAKGYLHNQNGKPCQDFSSSYEDESRTIITCCDGHGGNIYIRSDLGSNFASRAIMKVFLEANPKKLNNEKYLDSLRLSILCEWNQLVEFHLMKNRITKKEIEGLSEQEKTKLLKNPIKAYGTTLIGALLAGDKLVVVHLGDGESFLVKKGAITNVFTEEDDDPVGNLTYSLCEEDAYQHLKITCVDFKRVDGVLLCTDGLANPFQNYYNFQESFIKPLCKELTFATGASYIKESIVGIAEKYGLGDDVSVACIFKEKRYH